MAESSLPEPRMMANEPAKLSVIIALMWRLKMLLSPVDRNASTTASTWALVAMMSGMGGGETLDVIARNRHSYHARCLWPAPDLYRLGALEAVSQVAPASNLIVETRADHGDQAPRVNRRLAG